MFFELLYKRRSNRSFTSRQIEQEKINQLKKAALLAPSSMARFPCRFIFITERDMLRKLAKAKKHGAEFLAQAALAVVIAVDPAVCDVWIEDASIATTYLHLAAEALGLGSCWIQIRMRETREGVNSEEYVKKLVGLPPDFRVLSIVGMGYSDRPMPPHTDADLNFSHIFKETYKT